MQVNPSDVFSLQGVYPGFTKIPGTPGFDGESLGRSGHKLGNRVMSSAGLMLV